ncbi:MAG: CNNM domain-containing protein [Thermacetogeniaceae bacterium]|jgi:CBS domain containing-hemolysin-like protein
MPERNKWLRRGLGNALLTFILSLMLTYVASVFLGVLVVYFALLVLLLVILLGVGADMVGFAAVAADVAPLNAKAANRVSGARQAVRLIRNADQVAVFCSDVMGDISSTLAGAMGAVIVFRMITERHLVSNWYTIIMTALVAAVTVCGKALGKGIALQEASEIMFRLGQAVAWVERLTGHEFFVPSSSKRPKR